MQRKDGSVFPVRLHISALRGRDGEATGLVMVAIDQSMASRQEPAQRESTDRYRDLFENSSEMIATLESGGRFLYANPAWKRCFGLDKAALMELASFEERLGPVAALRLPRCCGVRWMARRSTGRRCATKPQTGRCWSWS